jgi:hypothetical protein
MRGYPVFKVLTKALCDSMRYLLIMPLDPAKILTDRSRPVPEPFSTCQALLVEHGMTPPPLPLEAAPSSTSVSRAISSVVSLVGVHLTPPCRLLGRNQSQTLVMTGRLDLL